MEPVRLSHSVSHTPMRPQSTNQFNPTIDESTYTE